MGYKGKSVQGEIPESGAIFMSNVNTHKECLERKLFGLPSGMSNFVLHVKEGMTLFLFEFERRLLYGVFRATSDGEINIDPKAFRSSGRQFPAQVRFTTVCDCNPLAENEFQDVIRDNYYSKKKFHFGLNKKQVSKLMKLFRSKRISENYPERNIQRYNDNLSEGNARPGDLKNSIRHRIRFDSCDSRGDEVRNLDDDMYINKHIIESRHYMTESDDFGDSSRRDRLGKHLDFRTNGIEEGYTSVLSKAHGTKLDGIGLGSSEFSMNAENKDLIESRHYTTESDEFVDSSRHHILGKNHDFRKNDIEDGYMSVFSKPHETHLDEIGLGSNEFSMNAENKDVIDYKRLQDEYNIREGLHGSFNEYPLTNQGDDVHISPCFDDGSGFIPIANNYPVYPSPRKLPLSTSNLHYSYDVGPNQNQHLDDSGSHSSIYPNFIYRNLSSPDAGLRVHDRRFFEKHESKHSFGAIDKRVSVFSRLTKNLRHEEQALESDEKHELNSSVDKVMKMLEKVVSSPKKRSGKNISVYKQDDADKSPDSKIKVHEISDVKFELDADMADEEAEGGESIFQETRLVDFKRRKKLNKKTGGASKEDSKCLVGATSDAGSVANDELIGMPCKRRKLVRPAFAHENVFSVNDDAGVLFESSEKVDDIIKSMAPPFQENTLSANDETEAVLESSEKGDDIIKSMVPACHENALFANDSADVVLESSKKADDIIKSMVPPCQENTLSANDKAEAVLESSEKVDDIIKFVVPTCHENTPDDGNLTKAEIVNLKKADVSIKHIDLNSLPTCDEIFSPKDDNSTKVVLESEKDDNNLTKVVLKSQKDDSNLSKAVLESQKRGNEGDGNAGSRLVSVKGTEPKDDENTCGWIEW